MKRQIKKMTVERPTMARSKRQGLGFSLIELAVVLAITAVIGLAIWKLLPAMRGSTNVDAPAVVLQTAQTALDGFILRQHRLPCPANLAAANGFEDCSGGTQVGLLPYATLGLAANHGLRYGVYRNSTAGADDADLAVLKRRFTPITPVTIIGVENGLDFCTGLKNAIVNPNLLAASSGGIAIAYGLAHTGGNGQFDGANNAAAPTFELTSVPSSATYDDKLVVSGHLELFGRLNCAQRLGNANGAARALYAAFDNDANAALYAEFRAFALGVREKNLAFAISTAALAYADLDIALAGGLTAAALAAATVGVGALGVAGSIAAVAAATAALASAVAGVVSAGIALGKATDQRNAANTNKSSVTAPTLERARVAAVAAIKQGLLP